MIVWKCHPVLNSFFSIKYLELFSLILSSEAYWDYSVLSVKIAAGFWWSSSELLALTQCLSFLQERFACIFHDKYMDYKNCLSWEWLLKATWSNCLQWTGTPTAPSGCSEPCPAWPWVSPEMGHPPPLWATCAAAPLRLRWAPSWSALTVWFLFIVQLETNGLEHWTLQSIDSVVIFVTDWNPPSVAACNLKGWRVVFF